MQSPATSNVTLRQVSESGQDNVVQRLKRRIEDAKSLGFRVRMELLDDEEASWCIVGKNKFMIVDLSQTAHEQLRQLDEALQSYSDFTQSLASDQEAQSVAKPARTAA